MLLAVICLIVAAFIWVSVDARQGAFAAVLLPLGALALALFGGPERLARQVTVSEAGIRVDRFHRVTTSVDWSELDDATVRRVTDSRGREHGVLVLDPIDSIAFFTRHRALRSVRVDDQALVPLGRNSAAATELDEALHSIDR